MRHTGATALVALDVPGPWHSVGERLAHVADALPGRVAVSAPSGSLTYGELLATATAWARALRRAHAGVPAGKPIALDIRSDAESVAALLAVTLAGRAGVPLDPMLPEARIATILERSDAIRTSAEQLAALPAAGEEGLPQADLDDPAVIFFTSGSTGVPKGLVHPHAAWLNQAYAARLAFGLTEADCNALVLPMSYGGGLDVVFMSLLNGCELHVHDPRVLGVTTLMETMRRPRVTTVLSTPSLLRSMLDVLAPGEALPGLRVTATCGEPTPSSLVVRLRTHLEPGARYLGMSGASEIGTLAEYPLPPDAPVPPGIIPVGFPSVNKRVEVVGEDGAPLGPGETGAVTVTSRYLSQGYFGDPGLTAERFTANPDGTTTYRGGDLGRWDEDGVLHLRGRADDAVKVGGYLVEPVEVEAALLALPGVREATVSPVRTEMPDGAVRVGLVAHVVPIVADTAATPAAIRRALRERLPSWMVPAQIVLLGHMPRTERGKTARDQLPPTPPTPAFREPEGPTERLLADVWCSVLGLEEVSAAADFWLLGADSLSVEELIVAVRGATGVTLTSGDLAGAPTIAELAALIDRRDTGSADLPPTAVRLRRGTGRRQVFAFAGGGAPALSLLPIATSLTVDATVHGFQAAGYERRQRPDWTLPAVVRRHLRTIRALAPSGPYVLVGHSFGGLLALETAALLRDAGEDVPLVVLLDTILTDAVLRDAVPPAEAAPAPIPPLSERLRMHARLLGAGFVRFPPLVRDAVFWEQSLRMINRHRLTTWNGRTLVFMASDNPDDPVWWGQVLTGEHELVPIDGGHSSILRPPFHRPIAARLDLELAALGA